MRQLVISVFPKTATSWSSSSLSPPESGVGGAGVGLASKAPSEPGKATGNPKLDLGRTGGGDRPERSVKLLQNGVSCEP